MGSGVTLIPQRLGESGMNCFELQRSLIQTEDGNSSEQQAHLKTCPECSALVTELNLIASSAIRLRAADEPSPRVWNSIEMALRREGLIRPPKSTRSLLPFVDLRWASSRWLTPAAAALLITVGVLIHQYSIPRQLANDMTKSVVSAEVSDVAVAGLNDDDLLQEIGELPPAVKAQYTDNLRRVNEYIQDAKGVVAADPNDEDARRSLLEAYQQKAMLFELAMDRSLP